MIATSSTKRRRRPAKSYAKEIAAFKRLREFVDRLATLRDTAQELIDGPSLGLRHLAKALDELRSDVNETATDALLGDWP